MTDVCVRDVWQRYWAPRGVERPPAGPWPRYVIAAYRYPYNRGRQTHTHPRGPVGGDGRSRDGES